MKKVGVVSGSGFIGSSITKQFLDNRFENKISSTKLSKKEKYQHLNALKNADHLTIYELKVGNKEQPTTFVKVIYQNQVAAQQFGILLQTVKTILQ